MQTVLRLYYIMMDPAADDLLTASIGRSPRNDPDPPGPHQADFHGLPLDNATKPASTEAQLRQPIILTRYDKFITFVWLEYMI